MQKLLQVEVTYDSNWERIDWDTERAFSFHQLQYFYSVNYSHFGMVTVQLFHDISFFFR